MKKIFPDSIIDSSVVHIGKDFNKNHNLLYLTILLGIIAALISMFFIRVDIVVTSSGIIKAEGERNIITAPMNGRLSIVKLEENSSVSKGDTLFLIRPDNITAQLPALNQRREELTAFLEDIGLLIGGASRRRLALSSPVYRQEHLSYLDQLREYEYNLSVAEKNFRREQNLFQSEVTSRSDLEMVQEKYEVSRKAIDIYRSKAVAQWQVQKSQYENELREVETSIAQLDIQADESVVCAPVSGTIQKLENVADGMFVHAGQTIIELSPDGELIAECYILPRDIGLIRENQTCNIQVDAYNYNQWGMLTGHVKEIFKDVLQSDDYSFYKIYCTLDFDTLRLKNGYEGVVKKGMTLTCRMIVTRRTIAQLLYDKVDDWLNPNLI